MQSLKTVIINCAGVGSRLGIGVPKALIKINGKPIIIHHLENLNSVKDVRIVVGYQKEDLIKTVLQYRKDVTFVFNQKYSTTNTLESLRLGAQFSNEFVLSIDGDLLVEPRYITAFLESNDEVLGYCESYTDEAVYCTISKNGTTDCCQIDTFSRQKSKYEWTGLALIKSNLFTNKKCPETFYETKHIYQLLDEYLPIKGSKINCYEVDTPNDLKHAKKWAKKYLRS